MFLRHQSRFFCWRLAICGAIVLGAQAIAAPPDTQATQAKRQINSCMVRRMGADKTLSYNDAMRLCKERSQPAKEALASITPGDAGTKAH
jgi:hypothetical protein